MTRHHAHALPLLVTCLIAFGNEPSSQRAFAQSNLFQFTKKVDTATQVPNQPTGTDYNNFGMPSIHNGTVAYRATYPNPNNTADLVHNRVDKVLANGQIIEVLDTPDLPTASVPDLIVSDVTIFSGDVGFSGPTANVQGATHFRTAGNALLPVASSTLGRATFYDNNVAFAEGPPSGSARIRVVGQNSIGTIIQQGDLVPQGNGVTFGAFGIYVDHNISSIPLIQNRSVALLGFWDTGNFLSGGIYRWEQNGNQTGTVIRVADANVSIPGQSGNFDDPNFGALPFQTTKAENSPFIPSSDDNTSRPSLYGKTTAFSFDDFTRAGAFRHNNGSLKIIADINTPHPTLSGTFHRFEGVSTVGGSTAFIASGFASGVAGSGPERRGLYLEYCSQLLEVLREGQTVDNKMVTNIELGHRGLAVSSPNKLQSGLEVAFRVEFDDSSAAIYTATYHKTCAATDVLIGNAIGPFDPTDPDDGPIGDVNFFSAPIYDEFARLEASLEASSSDGAPVVFGGDVNANLFGVEGPGSDDDLIDFAVGATGVISEQISVSYNQAVLVDGLHLQGFDPGDSALIEIGGHSIRVTGVQAPTGHISLAGLPLNTGQAITIGWDPLNSTGDGFSYNAMAFTPVPEPTMFALFLSVAFFSCVLRRPSLWSRIWR